MASEREVLVVGAGRRVREAALPALHRLGGRLRVRTIAARSPRTLVVEGIEHPVEAFDRLDARRFERLDLVYVAVGKDAVPSVLAGLARRVGPGTELLLDTPVVRFKHFAATRHLRAFARVSVAEDCAYLPWVELLRRARVELELGEGARLELDRSAWAYHGIATARAVLAEGAVRGARRRRLAHGVAERRLVFAGGGTALVREPRDYAVGRVALIGPSASVGEPGAEARVTHALEAVLDGDACRGLRAGPLEVALDDDEADLTRGDPARAGITARMEAMKRVGLLRLLRDVAAGRGGYPLEHGLEDMVVDYWLERAGRYSATALSDPRSALARGLYRCLTRPWS